MTLILIHNRHPEIPLFQVQSALGGDFLVSYIAKIGGICAARGNRIRDNLHERRTAHPLDQALAHQYAVVSVLVTMVSRRFSGTKPVPTRYYVVDYVGEQFSPFPPEQKNAIGRTLCSGLSGLHRATFPPRRLSPPPDNGAIRRFDMAIGNLGKGTKQNEMEQKHGDQSLKNTEFLDILILMSM